MVGFIYCAPTKKVLSGENLSVGDICCNFLSLCGGPLVRSRKGIVTSEFGFVTE